jgi:cytidylate kinase
MNKDLPLTITISRQLGSGGAYVGQQLAKKLGIFYADREIISQAAKKLSMLENDVEVREEKIDSFWKTIFKSYSFNDPATYTPPKIADTTDDEIYKVEREIILHIAEKRSAVIIGRCSSYILKDLPNSVSIFLHANKKFRQERLKQLYNLTDEAARKKISRSDKERSIYYRNFTGEEWIDVKQYDLTLNTSKIGLDNCVEMILSYLKIKKME